ncbi:GMC family oxidoreductase [Amycolatopsis sp. OK19-0408]|uniref:GMC family oxidoreductase n=1 Tax=Amycolatopsis iheyensis TaxID=2945988 RepID=A0A9X2NFC2_9PSEU|nr:GMC family oxidoreductase [Amycolatopsis iheyensis]MCR6485777.1 GMC family oxidoreductase [Amycolatopsis iheyensis]
MSQLLGAGEAAVVTRVCELLVPGSAAARPDRYLAATLPALSSADEDAVHAAIGVLAGVSDVPTLARVAGSAAVDRFRLLAIEAFYGDHTPPGRRGPDRADVLVIGAGGGAVAAVLAARGADVLLLDSGPGRARFVSAVDDEPIGPPAAPGPVKAERAPASDVAKFHERTGLLGAAGPFGPADLEPWYDRPVPVSRARVRRRHDVRHVLVDTSGPRPKVTGVACTGGGVLRAPVVVLAAGPLATPRILLHTHETAEIDSPSARLTGRTLGLRPARLVYGLLARPQAPRTGSGFTVEPAELPGPVAFAASLVDPADRPLWGGRLAEVVGGHPGWTGLRVPVADDNTAVAGLGVGDEVVVGKRFSTAERRLLTDSLETAAGLLREAGARDVVWSGLFAAHPQGGAPMGDDPARSVVGPDGRSHDVDGLYVADASLLPAVLSVAPDLTVRALAAKVAEAIR